MNITQIEGLVSALEGREPVITKSTGYAVWTGSAWSFVNEAYSLSSHSHTGVYEPVIAAGTTLQYLRGDKTWQAIGGSTSDGSTYLWANSTERSAQTGMSINEVGLQVDTSELYKYNGSSWILTGTETNADWIRITTFVATPVSTSTLNINNSVVFANIAIGDGIKFRTAGVYYYARVSAKGVFTGGLGLITIEGIALTTGSASITELYFGKEKKVGRPVTINIVNGDWTASPLTDVLNDGLTAYPISTPAAYLVAYRVLAKTVDTGATKGAIKVLGNDRTTNISSLSDGVILATAKTYASSLVTINPAKYKFAGDTNLKVSVSQPGTNKNTTEAILELYFIFE